MKGMLRTSAISLVAVLVAASVVSCTARNSDACDGGKPVATKEEAVSKILRAAYAGDADEACSVINGHPSTADIADGLKQLKSKLQESGINADNAVVEDTFQGGSLVQVRVSSGSKMAQNLTMDLFSIRGEGYRFGWPLSFE